MVNILAICVFALTFVASNSYANVVALRDCEGYTFVDKSVVIDVPFNENCILQFETQEDHILVFTVIDGDMKDAQNFIAIHDGIGIESPLLLVENQMIHDRSRKDLPAAVYTTQSTGSVRLIRAPISNLQLKVQKAVNCPFNLGLDSQCGRVVDEVSCYCATFINRNHPDQTMFCIDHNMKLISFENRTEEVFVQAAWGTQVSYWTSLTDSRRLWSFIWESTMTVLSDTSYSNWCPNEPNNYKGGERCVFYGGVFTTCWGDAACTAVAHAVCEAQPSCG